MLCEAVGQSLVRRQLLRPPPNKPTSGPRGSRRWERCGESVLYYTNHYQVGHPSPAPLHALAFDVVGKLPGSATRLQLPLWSAVCTYKRPYAQGPPMSSFRSNLRKGSSNKVKRPFTPIPLRHRFAGTDTITLGFRALTHSRTHSLSLATHSLAPTHPLTHSHSLALTHSLTHSLTRKPAVDVQGTELVISGHTVVSLHARV